MAFSWKQFLGIEAKKPDIGPIVNVPPPDLPKSLTEFPVTKDLEAIIKRGMTEGFGPEFVSKTTSPLVAGRERRFAEEEAPFLESQMSARGLGRSTIAGRELGRIGTQKEQDINEMIARAVMANEAEKARQQQMAFGFGGAEAGLKTGAEQAAYNAAMTKALAQFGAGETGRLETQANINKLIASGFDIGRSVMQGEGVFGSGLPGIWGGGGGAGTQAQWQQAMNVKQAETASPFTAQGSYDFFKKFGTKAAPAAAIV